MKFKRISYLIALTALITVGIQVYRNIQNYQLNKQRFMSDMQAALDISVESYFTDLARNDLIIFSSEDTLINRLGGRSWSMVNRIGGDTAHLVSGLEDSSSKRLLSFNGRRANATTTVSIRNTFPDLDSLLSNDNSLTGISIEGSQITNFDSLNDIKGFFKKVMFSLSRTSLDHERLTEIMITELDRKNIEAGFVLWHYVDDSLISESNHDHYNLSTVSQSNYLPRDQKLVMNYENASLNILKRGALDLFISLLITGAVIGCLLYLYKVISEQKQLAEIKNDLISNITHEFKTPIATVSTAIEAISSFNKANDPAKTAKYLDISSNQLQKLNGMVEKLLETASLDSDELELSLESVELVRFSQQIFDKFQLIKGDKTLYFQTAISEYRKEIDPFHLENAISNLIDNAIKYGGDEITLKLSTEGDNVSWQVVDNGGKIDKTQQQRIFDQFYRIPTGNVHDVKGFGIGLYYTKKIVEKHEGEISLSVDQNVTDFTIQI
ncbi:sensor histidine kinase [Roseivirga sp. 4D4]|uniref:sensor histidine kinase n=1 Tax=Roseivirga sp. 4D4 TaxID=1889784 RepID=UPI000A56E29B|nr:HAMP domain-containing sensor histidine kinase [Roseivirga sp. 4D4]